MTYIIILEKLTNSPSWVELIQSCIDSEDINKRVEMLEHINRLLPKENMIKLPSFITNDYIDKALYLLEERLLYLALTGGKQEIFNEA